MTAPGYRLDSTYSPLSLQGRGGESRVEAGRALAGLIPPDAEVKTAIVDGGGRAEP